MARLTYRFRLKDKHDAELRRQARAVNFVWNFCGETQKSALRWRRKWPSAYDLSNLTAGSSKDLGLHAHTIQKTCETFARSRDAKRKPMLRWRGKKSLGWVPFSTKTVRYDGEAFVFRGVRYFAWVSRHLEPGQTFGAGAFSQDARGRWYINVPVEVESLDNAHGDAIGIDLGLKDLATISTGEKIEAPRWYRRQQEQLAVAQRARKKKLVSALHAKIANKRKDHLHKISTRLVQSHGAIFVGNVNAAGLAKTKMAKSVLDAGWTSFRDMLRYKAIRHGVLFEVVNEAFSTQACSCCGAIPASSPKGRADLGMRRWTCSDCGADHDRDVNAARNIAARGLAGLAEGAEA